MNCDRRETEVSFVLCSECPEALIRDISDITRLGEYVLQPQPCESIRDRYFDTRSEALKERRIALRIRQTESGTWVTLKGPSVQGTSGHAVSRPELELPLSAEALESVVRELATWGVSLAETTAQRDATSDDPATMMAGLGLTLIQARETHRELRNIRRLVDPAGAPIAEMALDSVTYHFGCRVALLHELELEAKGPGGVAAIEELAECFLNRFGPSLRPWNYGKLLTGKILETWAERGEWENLVDSHGNLKPVAYERMEAFLGKASGTGNATS